MGEVYLGLQEGAGGFERFVVIKRIYPQFVGEEHFTSMLLEEARLVASIRHPNVVQILDIGQSADGHFIVMEYLPGETLLFITRTLQARGEIMPPSVACRIVAEIAAGLHCAHTATDAAGRPQPIVHGDVTPSNLILCFNGVVKILDFGVARAPSHEGPTRAGQDEPKGLQGKTAYLAPEQLYDDPIDGRADVFQLGICLHEFLTGRRLFKAGSDHQRIMAVLHQRIPPPSELVPTVPAELDELVLWALERDPERRPATADEFGRELELAAASVGAVSGHDLGGWMRSAFAERLLERTRFERKSLAELREGRAQSGEMLAIGARAASRSDADGEPSSSGRAGVAVSASAGWLPDSASFSRSLPSDVIGLSPPPSSDTQSRPPYPGQRSRSRQGTGWLRLVGGVGGKWPFLGLATLVVMVAFGIAFVINAGRRSPAADSGQGTVAQAPAMPQAPATAAGAAGVRAHAPPSQPRSFDVSVSVVPAQATIDLDGVEVGRGSYRASFPADGTPHVMRVRADGYGAVELDFTDQPPPSRIRLAPTPAAAAWRDRAVADKPTRRAQAPEPTRKRAVKPRARADEARGDESRDDGAMSDNPDPWADEADEGAGHRPPEGSE